jgi:exodeoxyribonuclease V gamma subunit
VVTYTGANEFSGLPRPPAVPLGEVLDALDHTATTADGGPVSHAVTIHHPLQPFDERNLLSGALVPDAVFSFDAAAASGARAAGGPRVAPAPFVLGSLPPRPAADVSLTDLVRFWSDPVKGFLGRDGVDVALAADEEQPEDSLPVEIDNLAQWAVGDRVLRDLLAGVEAPVVKQREWRRGLLPPGRLGWRMLDDIVSKALPLREAGLERRSVEPRSVDVSVDLGGGRWLRGTVPEVYGDRLAPVHYSRLGARHRLASWLWLLALNASDGDRNWTAHTLGRPTNSRSRDSFSASLLGPLDHSAADVLGDLVSLRDAGLRGPLPVPLKTSLRYARARRARADAPDALEKAGYEWASKFGGERDGDAVLRIWGHAAPVPGLDAGPGPGEEFPGETTRFGALALRVWSPLIQAEQGGW